MASSPPRPQLVAPRAAETLEAVRSVTGGSFDPDVFYIMEERDNQLIADQLMHGALSAAFLYKITISGHDQVGVSATGARHLAVHYKGLQFRLVADAHKVGAKVYCQQFPGSGLPFDQFVRDGDPEEADYYMVLGEMTDVKTGNRFQAVKREARYEARRDGTLYERPNYQTIAQSKVERNLILHMVPQDIRLRWQQELLRVGGKMVDVTEGVIDTKRASVLRFAAQKALPIDRRRVDQLTLDQISGLGDAAREGNLSAFAHAAQALGLTLTGATDEAAAEPEPQPRRRGRPPLARPQPQQSEEPPPIEDAEPESAPEPPRSPGRNVEFDL